MRRSRIRSVEIIMNMALIRDTWVALLDLQKGSWRSQVAQKRSLWWSSYFSKIKISHSSDLQKL
jgi:hypothetical protein